MASYYKKIKGKNYDGRLLKKADSSVKGRGDGRISLKDARGILAMVKDSDEYSGIEKNTIKYIRDHYDFTPDADKWFRMEIRKWAATKKPARKAAKKSVKKSKPSRKKAARKMTRAEKRQEERDHEELLAVQEASRSMEAPPRKSSLAKKLGIAIILLGLVLLGLWFNPSSRDWIKSRCPLTGKICEKKPEPAEEVKPPAAEVEKKAVPEQQPAEVKPAEVKPPEVKVEEGEFYIVQVKDSLVSIAEKELGKFSRWGELYQLNRATVPNNFHLYPGQKLKMPPDWKK